ncbi:hypothetical protein SDC9_139676 [bioreactor metagenome]|uniref:Uncharacterized protein n=1 Tax=bioreactor metagenome TaxID=1076179 RepID=A0A645DT90_9ZZZZ
MLLQQPTGGVLHSVCYDRRESYRESLREFRKRGHRKVFFVSYEYDPYAELFLQIAAEEKVEAENFLFSTTRRGQMERIPEFAGREPAALLYNINNAVLLDRIFDFLRELGRERLPEVIEGYSRPHEEIFAGGNVIGYIHVPFQELIKQIAARSVEIAKHPGETHQEILVPTHFVRPEEIGAVRERDRQDLFFISMEEVD